MFILSGTDIKNPKAVQNVRAAQGAAPAVQAAADLQSVKRRSKQGGRIYGRFHRINVLHVCHFYRYLCCRNADLSGISDDQEVAKEPPHEKQRIRKECFKW